MDPHDVTARGHNGNGQHPLSLPHDDELDELAELFLGPGDTGASAHPARGDDTARPAGLLVEGLVLGHLPVLASAWPAQYARGRAEELGMPVALVRLAPGAVSVEIFGGGFGAAPDLASAAGAVRSDAALAVVRVAEGAEAELATLGSLDGVTLLSGADDAAIVACYRKLKGLACAAAESGGSLPAVRLAIMGAERSKAELAQERIARAARAFLDADLLAPLVVERVGPTGGQSIFRGSTDLGVRDLVRLLLAEHTPTGIAPAHQCAPAPERPVLERPALERPAPERAPPAPTARPAPVPPTPDRRESLAPLAGDLVELEARCPEAPRVELACDGSGSLHLIAARLAEHPGLCGVEPLRDLVRAAAWARVHWALLVRAERSLDAGSGEPRLHLISDRGQDARALAGTPVRVHLAVRAEARALGLATVCLED